MFLYDPRTKKITETHGGYSDAGLPIRDTFVKFGMDMRCVLYEPVSPTEKSRIGLICIHSDGDYSTFPIGGELAKRGYRTLCGQVSDKGATLDAKMRDVGMAVEFLRAYPGIEKVLLLGHSGGATLMTAYQAAAEKGVGVFQTDNMLVKCSLKEPLPAADGLLSLDANWGNGTMSLISLDPAVVEEGNGMKLDPELDAFDPANGFDPEGSAYSEAFLKKFFEAQAARNNAVVKRALERLHAIENGKGFYADDEPFSVTGGAQFAPCNKLFPQDIRLVNHTKGKYTLIHPDGSETVEVVHSVRPARGGRSITSSIWACEIGTVRSYLTNRGVLAGDNYAITPDGIEGVQWNDVYCCPPGNVRYINVPLLVMGMTGSYEYLASEAIYNAAVSADKSIAFVEGAGHNFDCRGREAEFGDTQKTVFDYVDKWLSAEGRF